MKKIVTQIVFTLLLLNSTFLTADDLEIYQTLAEQQQTNISVILAIANPKNSSIIKTSLKDTLNALHTNKAAINIALMAFSSVSGSYLVHKPINISDSYQLQSLNKAIDKIPATQSNANLIQSVKEAQRFSRNTTACQNNLIVIISDQATQPIDNRTIHNIVLNTESRLLANQQLTAVFDRLLYRTIKTQDTLATPAIAVDRYNRMQHRDDIYFALFQPKPSPRWPGNIKKYKLENTHIVDANGHQALQRDTGDFKDSTLSFWTDPTDWPDDAIDGLAPDGNNINHGGYAYQLPTPDQRKIYTYLDNFTPDKQRLSATDVKSSNLSITTTTLGLAETATQQRNDILNWVRGASINKQQKTPNHFVADIIHNRPAVVTYRTLDKNNFDDTVFAGSNRGLFYAIKADTGEPVFSFIPQQLLPNLTHYYQNQGTFNDKIYGLDAPMTVWRYDKNNNGSIVSTSGDRDTAEVGEHIYIYQAMRRGGKSLYALDVTLRQNPKLLWQINGNADLNGNKQSDATPGFSDLGQTWSTPQLAKIQWNCAADKPKAHCEDKSVLFFAGGYDPKHDNSPDPYIDEGNALYMVDAKTGKLLWSAGYSRNSQHSLNLKAMTHSIPANITPIDIEGDGYTDYLFAIDILGQLWRIDLYKTPTSKTHFAHKTRGGIIADLGGGKSGSERRYYNAPDIALVSPRGRKPFLAIALGSGYRAAPKSTHITDHFYVVFDPYPYSAPPGYNYNYNDDRVISTADMAAATLKHGKKAPTHTEKQYGWYYSFSNNKGEKVLAPSLSFNHQILLTTYIPATKQQSCASNKHPLGTGRYYLLNLLNGQSTLSDNGSIKNYQTLNHGGIPPEPLLIFLPKKVCPSKNCTATNSNHQQQDNLLACIGTECIDNLTELTLDKTYWRENNE
ncbi:pilus assembly protein [Oceanicoccus sagamiensis]|uniref:PilY1 beta-propeller domain-containing protein n=1 Tax=Oceanicoccus sagamiensis TaxID=716816 RepID=A0A1X9NFQ5_9GAMM|nr:PilC/PilY family type IV pilus protein [Oceanicoccus sagamiensis]ARN72843.1 hypothetical protein BST96_01215 [Oceanicoccus sagamiensis]